ncbi:MAG TPA: hypothetical protein DCE56_10715 [Cyanobacteria bacterium UBA8553]|nr:hypothetical protein [Cyanobacteria bacterium UBA8553]HAJ62979.1 hypothetical protein [Cyanobacteria bacterium UBA8543]
MTNAGIEVIELNGKPGQVWGNVVIPASGKTRFRLTGDMIQASSRLFFGLEKKQIYTRIQSVDSVELVEGRQWWLLWLGIPLLSVVGIGLILIIAFLLIKRRWLVIYSQNAVLILFYESDDTERASQFSQIILDQARQLNNPSPLVMRD